MAKDVIVACDFPSREAFDAFLALFTDCKPFLKIGMELYYACGPDIVKEAKRRGHKVFLDLKLHDIPNTVGKATSVLNELGADICNVHAAGGVKMMAAARTALREDALLIAVTQLTSTSAQMLKEELLINQPMEDVISHYALNAKAAGLNGIVCSPLEAAVVKKVCGEDFITVTPGIRFADAAADDQVRITTPAKAREIGSDYIVVGRPITAAQDPVAAYKRCVAEFLNK